MPANRDDTVDVAPLIWGIEFGAMFADKALDSNGIIDGLNARSKDRDFAATSAPAPTRH
ncbi:hypothetical protein [Roseobacter cerasinus]|nr:hypothetical protein [Roseobacter cerasinus]